MVVNSQDEEDASYIDYETFLAPGFNPAAFANSLVLSTNNPNDSPLDLSTPLSRVLFDIQEIDSHIDQLTTRSAIPLLTHTEEQTAASGRIITEIDGQVKALNASYKQLEREVTKKHAEADTVRQVASRLWETLRLGRSVARCLQLGRQLQVQHSELAASATTAARREDHNALVRCTHTILSLREILERKAPGEEGHGLDRIDAIRSLQETVIAPIERSVQELSERIVREFSIGSSSSSGAPGGGGPTFAQMEEAKARMVSALVTLYLLSPTALAKNERWSPSAMVQALEIYLRSALQSSIASLARSLAALPSLDRTLAEVSARCQNIVALELVLESTKAPPHPLRLHPPAVVAAEKGNLLQPLLAHLETGSLASYFWRTMASSLATRVQEIMNRGGVSARTLRSNKSNVGEAIRECVVRGCQLPGAAAAAGAPKAKAKGQAMDGSTEKAGGWDREIAVMVGSVVGNIGR
ncbi:golgi transport complex component Cog5 [Gaeumannomyces tritici R3-111a-1]|uniref:Conserved oligomeric Golgi complex subunit 5 n=1 Tax=Gaeumannomyces tritici (strain R3-111a-1) TaxID=644352 RepID=J3NVG9_GAET3|nr:golgi transport complex component Cog5 [Gaeumannomyces tritici R3-111a-1]EJT75347.1 golgi transport complex component Cog5 [Gaeumannomyces tritici R3-111a-1]